jgi:hypothetical protein
VTAEQYLTLLYPFYSTVGDPRYQTPEIITGMLQMAQSRRPVCLSEEQQNEAQAHYAAYLLGKRHAGTVSAEVPDGTTVKREKQGNVEVEYAAPTSASDAGTGPSSAYSSWKALNDMCAVGSIIVSDAWIGSGGAPP